MYRIPFLSPPAHRLAWLLAAALFLNGCDSGGQQNRLTKMIPWLNKSPYERYLAELTPSQALLWQASAEAAHQTPLVIAGSQYAETGQFSAEEPRAEAFRISLAMGEQLRIAVRTQSTDFSDATHSRTLTESLNPALFAELYEGGIEQKKEHANENEKAREDWQHLQTLTVNGAPLALTADGSRELMLVLQAPLNASLTYQLEISRGGSLFIPVEGASLRNIGGGFGVPRDGGRRVHHGVDIFAKRGTPIYAVADGWVRTGDTRIGGKVVWLRPLLGGVSYYYAHLDTIGVTTGEHVKRGDYLGTVGNTGNAVSTPPHLHFGIYKRSQGPVDPAPFLSAPPTQEFQHASEFPLQQPHRVAANRLNLRQAPSAAGKVLASLQQGSRVSTLAATSTDWIRVLTEDGDGGFVHGDWLEAIEDNSG